jgi:hypothetical protein
MSLISLYRTPVAPPVVQLCPMPYDLGETAAAVALARDVAELLDTNVGETWWSLCNVHDNMLALLESPQGWSALAGYIACDLGLGAADYAPVVH